MAKREKGSEYISHGNVATNRKARFNYHIEDTIEAGLVLLGSEVKSLRLGRVNISDAYAAEQFGKLVLMNLYIGVWESGAKYNNHEPFRVRQLLLKHRDIERMKGAISKQGMTLVPLTIYFNKRGFAKVELGLAKGKQLHDKRETEKNREWDREKSRLMKTKEYD
jgi:SsrA-binding protein